MLEIVADYLQCGVPHFWIPDPYKRTVQDVDREGLRACPNVVVENELGSGAWT